VSLGGRYARGLLALGHGNFEDAYRHLAAISPPGSLPSHVPIALWSAMDLVEAALRSGHQAEAVAHSNVLREAKLAALSPRLALVSLGSEALTAPHDRAMGLFEEALALPGVGRWPFDLAKVQLAYGERLRRARAVSESHRHLKAAFERFERLGARPWAARAGTKLRVAGMTGGLQDEVEAERLTRQELEVAQLAASGLTNKEIGEKLFLSHRTVGAHLYRLFPKLGVTTRAALRDALGARHFPGSRPQDSERAR